MDQKSTISEEEDKLINVNLKDKSSTMEVKSSIGRTKSQNLKNSATSTPASQSGRLKFYAVVAAIIFILFWTFAVQLATLGDKFLVQKYWPSPPSERVYENNGYLMLSCNGGLNQMRTGICDMVAVAIFLNVTLIVPEMDNTSFWHDHSEFQDIFDEDYFIASLKDEIRILKELPPEEKERLKSKRLHSVNPVLWSSMSYYYNKILPQIKKHSVLHFMQTDARLGNNGLPDKLQKLRCRVNYRALRFTGAIEETGRKIVRKLRQKGSFLVLHLRYEMDMLSFTGCTEGLTRKEIDELMKMRDSYPWWKSRANPIKKRKAGLCPLTPDETALALQALGVDPDMQIYIASGSIYGGEKRLEKLARAFPKLVRKEDLLKPSDLKPFWNRSNQMAALDYIVSLESDIFVPTHEGNMAKAVEGHRRYLGFRTTIILNRRLLVNMIDQYKTGRLSWDEFCFIMNAAHADHMGKPRKRLKIRGQPREEDYFYSNPEECLPQVDEPSIIEQS